MDAVSPAELRRTSADGSTVFIPYGSHLPPLDDRGYVQEEWVAAGEAGGHPYTTTISVRRPEDTNRFSGVVIAEPLHVHGIAPIWMYSAPYILRSGHAWVEITSLKTALDMHVKPSNPQRYETLDIDGPDSREFDSKLRLGSLESRTVFWSELDRRSRASNEILAQVGAAIRASGGPFGDGSATHVILAGHSQTGGVTTSYIHGARSLRRCANGSPVYDGYFPSGFPMDAFHGVGVPVVQVMCEGDVARPDYSFRPGYEGRRYRRDDSDEPGGRFRLYELAGVPHMGTRAAPYNDTSLWKARFPDESGTIGPRMNSLPHFELFNMCLHHLVEWVANGTVPPRAERIEVKAGGYFAKDEHGNTRGGVRCAQLDIPHSTYRANPWNPDGTPSYLTVGSEHPFSAQKLRHLYRHSANYTECFNRRLDELISEGWFLAEDAEGMRREAEQVAFR